MATAPMNTADYFSRYFPVSVSGGTTQPATGLTDVSGQVSLADILANIQGQYAPLTFTQSGGSYGAGRFIGDFGQPTGEGSVGNGTTGGGGVIQPTFQPGEFDINAYATALPEELIKEIAAGTVYPSGESTGGAGGDGTPGGQGVSNTGINAALNAKPVLDALGNVSLLAKIAGYGTGKYLDKQIDAISEGFDVISGNDVVDTGMYTIVDKEGNVRTISNDDSIAAQNAGIFGTQPGASTADPSPVELGMTPSPAEGGGYVDGATAPTPAPVVTAEQLNNIQNFWASNPTTEQIKEAMFVNDLTPEQLVDTWTIATGGDKEVGLDAVNAVMTQDIVNLYQNTLGRTPDRDEVAYWKSVYDENLANNFAIAAMPELGISPTASASSGGSTFYGGGGESGGGSSIGGLLDTGVVVGGPITGDLQPTTPLGPLSGGDSSLTSDWSSSDWSSDYTSEFGG